MSRPIKYVLNTLIISYLVIIYFTGMPETNTFNERLKKNLQPVAFALGIWPSWSMFAPNPIKFDTKSYVEVTYADGKVEEHDVELNPTGALATFRLARWMKYSQDNLRSPNQKGLLDPALRHFHARFNSTERPVTKLVLKRKWFDVKPFSDAGISPVNESRIPDERSEILITRNYGANL